MQKISCEFRRFSFNKCLSHSLSDLPAEDPRGYVGGPLEAVCNFMDAVCHEFLLNFVTFEIM